MFSLFEHTGEIFMKNSLRIPGIILVISGILTAAIFLTGCGKSNLLSTKDEVKIGHEGALQIEKQYKVETNTPDAIRVRQIGDRLLEHIHERPGVPYSFKVLDNKEVNAFSLPGGPVYVFKGLLDMIGNDNDALATVIGHEIGHINARHAAKQISQQMETNLAISVLLRGKTTQDIAGLGASLINLRYSRDDEYEADKRGLSYAYKAGYDSNGMIRFFHKLEKMEKSGQTPEFLRDHPLTRLRIARATKIIETKDYPYGQ
jgi:predicted Zn-dependent protease